MWLRCIERPFALVGIAPHAYAPQGARTIAIYGHAPMELVSMPTAAANGAGEHILSMHRVRSTALACRGLLILHIMADHPFSYVCHIRSLRWLPELVSQSSLHYALPRCGHA